jgi:hypothetical protein
MATPKQCVLALAESLLDDILNTCRGFLSNRHLKRDALKLCKQAVGNTFLFLITKLYTITAFSVHCLFPFSTFVISILHST